MRNFNDKTGLQIALDTIQGIDAYSGMLEGTPWLARKFRLMQAKQLLNAGVYVHGLDTLEQEISTLPRNTEIWAPRERWEARMIACLDFKRETKKELKVVWYQNEVDPFHFLRSIIFDLDFDRHAKDVPFVLD